MDWKTHITFYLINKIQRMQKLITLLSTPKEHYIIQQIIKVASGIGKLALHFTLETNLICILLSASHDVYLVK